jgi:outer membrane immunogenic protein
VGPIAEIAMVVILRGLTMQRLAILFAAIATLAGTSVFAADMPVKAPPASLPTVWDWSGFYFGAGGSYNWSQFDQALQGVSGTINVVNSLTGALIAQGQEGGPFFDFNRHKSGFAPDVQLGYTLPFADGNWLAGLKFTYKYANINSQENVNIPQEGIGTIFVPPPPRSAPITGFVLGSAEINLKHQLALIATIGRAFGNVAVYAGGGPALFDVKTNFFNGVPFAQTPNGLLFAAGEPITIFNDNWVWGGAAQVGAMYAFAHGWFLDVNYTYAQSANFSIENQVSVMNQVGPLTISGPAVVNTHERVNDQSVMLTLNYQLH